MNVQFSQCVKSVRIQSFSGPYFPALELKMNQKNSDYGHFHVVQVSKIFQSIPFYHSQYLSISFTFPGGKVKSSPKTSALKIGGSSVHQWLHNSSRLSFTDVTAVGLSGCFGITVAILVFSTIFFNFFSLSYYFSSPHFQYLFIKLWRKTRICYDNMYLIGQTQECDILQWEL